MTTTNTVKSLICLSLTIILTAGCGGTGDALDQQPEVRISGDHPYQASVSELPLPSNDDPKLEQLLLLTGDGALQIPLDAVEAELKGDFSIELWLNSDRTNDQQILRSGGLELWIRDSAITAYVGSERMDGPLVVASEWYHVAVVVEGKQARLYVNGEVQERAFPGADWNRPRNSMTVGEMSSSGFTGMIDNLRAVKGLLYVQPYFLPSQQWLGVDNVLFGYNFNTELPGGIVPCEGGYNDAAQLIGSAGVVKGAI